MTYNEALAYISSLESRGWRLGLERMKAFCNAADLSDSLGYGAHPNFIHVAGTNGKGTTTAYLQSLMVETGFRTGAFFSPYVVDPRERIQFGRSMIAAEELAALTESLKVVSESIDRTENGGISEFEFKTAMGFAYWKARQCDWVALEVGLGGRFDATNVINPRASIIVSIGLDHMAILGDTKEKIAFEKAGIIKAGVPVVVGDLPPEATEVVERVASEMESPLWKWGRDIGWDEPTRTLKTPFNEYEDVRPGMSGVHQGHNLALAVSAMEAAGIYLTNENVLGGAKNAFAPGRFQIIRSHDRIWVFDGAHNLDAAQELVLTLRRIFPEQNPWLVTNMVRGHDLVPFYEPLVSVARGASVPPIDFHRAVPPEEAAVGLRRLGIRAIPESSLESSLEASVNATCGGDLIAVTGSFYLVGEALRHPFFTR